MEEDKTQIKVQEPNKWDNPSPGFDPKTLHHEPPSEPKLSLGSFPKWIILILILLFLVSIIFTWFIYFRKPSIKTTTKPSPTPTRPHSVCTTKPVCDKINLPGGCKIIQPEDPCKCASAYFCPSAK